MVITKIKYSLKGAMNIKYTQTDEHGNTSIVDVECTDPPHVDFIAAIRSLNCDIIDICELDESTEDVFCTGVSLKGEIEGFCLSGCKRLASNPCNMILNTPYCKIGDGVSYIPETSIKKLNKLIDEARNYIAGKRATEQKRLDFNVNENGVIISVNDEGEKTETKNGITIIEKSFA